jgi:putative resolvase
VFSSRILTTMAGRSEAPRRRHRQGRLAPAGRTIGDRLHYALCFSLDESATFVGKTICYARVSPHEQAEQLTTQAAWLEKHCAEAGFSDIEVATDLGNRLNFLQERDDGDC